MSLVTTGDMSGGAVSFTRDADVVSGSSTVVGKSEPGSSEGTIVVSGEIGLGSSGDRPCRLAVCCDSRPGRETVMIGDGSGLTSS